MSPVSDNGFMSETAAPSPTIALLTLSRVAELEMARLLEPHGLTLRKYGILDHIRQTPGLSVGALARRAEVTTQAVQVAVRGLVDAGWVRSMVATGGHAAQLSATPAGAALLDELSGSIADLDTHLFPDTRHDLARALIDTTMTAGAPPQD